MTATLIRPGSPGRLRAGTGTPVRVRPVPVTDPPAGIGAWWPARDRPTDRRRAPAPPPGGPVHRTTVDAHLAARRYLDLVLEVLGGYRPVGHLRVHTDATQFDEIVAELTHLGGPALTWPVSGLMQGSGLVQVSGERFRLRHVRTCEVRDGAVEAAAVLARGASVRAMTARLERTGRLWLCTHLQVL